MLGMGGERLLLSREEDQLVVCRQGAEGMAVIARLPWPVQAEDLDMALTGRLGALPRWWVLPADGALRRQITLPQAATERLHDVVRFEVDRQTPFQAADVRFDARVVGSRENGQVDAEMVVIPRTRADAVLSDLGELTQQLAGMDVMDAARQPLGVNLLPEEMRQRRSDPSRIWNGILMAVALIAIVMTGWQVLDNRVRAADTLEAGVDAETRRARDIAVQRQQLMDTIEGNAFLTRMRNEKPAVIDVLDELTRRVPDSTYLESLSIEGAQLQMTGQSNEASSLVAKLEGASHWRSPALTGALQPDARTRLDRFSLNADLVGAAKPADAPAAAPAAAGSTASEGEG